jgi:prevent-host-death family protein
MTVSNIHDAKTRLSELLEQALRGEEVIIAKNGTPIVRLEPLTPPTRQPGDFRGRIRGDITGGVGDDGSPWG